MNAISLMVPVRTPEQFTITHLAARENVDGAMVPTVIDETLPNGVVLFKNANGETLGTIWNFGEEQSQANDEGGID